jgi:iron complex outermembrane receptor protein
MTSLNSRALAAGLWLWAGAGVPARAFAAGKADGQADRAKALFKAGRHAYDLGRFDEALRNYGEAYDLKPVPSILFNIAQCHRKLGDLDKAAFFFQRFVDLDPRSSGAQTARDLLAEVKGQLAARDAEAQRAEEARQAQARADAEAQRLEAQRLEAARAQLAAEQAAQDKRRQQAVATVVAPPAGGLTQPTQAPPQPLYSRWYVWAGAGAAVVAAGTVTYFLATSPRPSSGSLGTLDAR